MEEVAADASAARHRAAARDRGLADLTVKADANREVISALGEQTRARFDAVHRRFDEVDREFAEMRGRLDPLTGGVQVMTDLLLPTRLLSRGGTT